MQVISLEFTETSGIEKLELIGYSAASFVGYSWLVTDRQTDRQVKCGLADIGESANAVLEVVLLLASQPRTLCQPVGSLKQPHKHWLMSLAEQTNQHHDVITANYQTRCHHTVMSMYTGAKTVVRTVYGNSNGFEVKVGLHQGSALSHFVDALHRPVHRALSN